MNNIGLFPITYDLLTLLKYKNILSDYSIKSICSFKEDRYLREISQEEHEILVSSDIEETMKKVDKIILLDNAENFLLNKYRSVVEWAGKNNKSVILSRKLYNQLQIPSNLGTFLFEEKNIENTDNTLFQMYENPLPVIAVCGMGENCSKFETTLLCLNIFKERGYKLLLIGANILLTLFGGHPLPYFLFDNSLSLEVKIYKFNRYIYMLQKESDYDAILIEIPGGIVPIGNFDHNHFSEIPLVISNALKIDIGFLNTYAPFEKSDKSKHYKNMCAYKYDIPLEMIFMSRQKVEYDPYQQKVEYLNMDEETYNLFYQKYCDDTIISFNDVERCKQEIRKMIQILENGVEFI